MLKWVSLAYICCYDIMSLCLGRSCYYLAMFRFVDAWFLRSISHMPISCRPSTGASTSFGPNSYHMGHHSKPGPKIISAAWHLTYRCKLSLCNMAGARLHHMGATTLWGTRSSGDWREMFGTPLLFLRLSM